MLTKKLLFKMVAWILVKGAIFVSCFVFLKVCNLANLCILLGALVLSSIVWNIIQNNIPRKFISPERKAVLVTGCDSGFGFRLASRLDKMGFHVYAGCLLPDQEGAKKLRNTCSDRLSVLPMDVTSDAQVDDAVRFISKNLGNKELCALVNNAGIGVFTEAEWCSPDTYRRNYEVNAVGTARVTRAVLPYLRKFSGRVVMVASLAGRYTLPGSSPYSMSKHAVISYADGLRKEMKKFNVSVHTIEPSLYKTGITHGLHAALERTWDGTSQAVQKIYGEDYYKNFQENLDSQLKKARENVDEVVDDIIHATVGVDPRIRYVPNFVVQMRAALLMTVPYSIQDALLHFTEPKALPASSPNKRSPSLKPQLSRSMSAPLASTRKRLANFRQETVQEEDYVPDST